MKKRVIRKSLLSSPSPISSSPLPPKAPSPSKESPRSCILTKRKSSNKKSLLIPSPSPSPPQNSLVSISDLKNLVSSRLSDLKSNLIDRSHSEILKDLEASHSRLHKRFKIQTQTCQQVMDEAEKDFKKMSERINESCEAMKESYQEIMSDAQATMSRVCKTTIPDLSKSYEKAIGMLQSRFGIQGA